MIDIMDWYDWIRLSPEEQETVRQRYTGSESMAGALTVERQQQLLAELEKA